MIPEKYRHDAELIRLTIHQLRKDFEPHLPEFNFSGSDGMLFDELTAYVAEAVRAIRKKNPAHFRSLLYRVDISEREMENLPDGDAIALAEKIIRREFQKVLTRRFFSKKGE